MLEYATADDLLTVAEAAAALGVQRDSVMGAIARGALPAIEVDGTGPRGRRLRVRRADLETYAANRRTWKRKLASWTPRWTVRL